MVAEEVVGEARGLSGAEEDEPVQGGEGRWSHQDDVDVLPLLSTVHVVEVGVGVGVLVILRGNIAMKQPFVLCFFTCTRIDVEYSNRPICNEGEFILNSGRIEQSKPGY